jgi:hypothetical protein
MHGSFRDNQLSVARAQPRALDEPRWKRDAWLEKAAIGALLMIGFGQAILAVTLG